MSTTSPPHRAIGAMSDIFFAVKLNDVLKNQGLELKLANSAEDAVAKLATPARLVVVDLNDRGFDGVALVRRLKQDEALRTIPILAFSSHVQTGNMAAAREAGAEAVVPRSVLADRLPELVAGLMGGEARP